MKAITRRGLVLAAMLLSIASAHANHVPPLDPDYTSPGIGTLLEWLTGW